MPHQLFQKVVSTFWDDAWAARKAGDCATLVERFERMDYAVRGKAGDAVAEVLKHPPTGPEVR